MADIRTTEEILARYKNWEYIRTDKNGTRYFNNYTCERCGGRGGWEGWPGFVCYECGGTGKSKPHVVKIYTPEHEAKLAAQRQARAEKRQKEREAKAIAERGQNLIAAGFGKEDDVYVIYRVVGNTYEIKDELKALGCKFKPAVGWFAPNKLDGYECQRLEEKDVLTDSIFIEWKDKSDVADLLIENIRKAEGPQSQWVGEIGQRLELELHIDRAFQGKGYMGKTSYLYLMSDADGNIFKWSTSCFYMEGDDVIFKATIKEHTEYKGTAQTVLTRCTLVKLKEKEDEVEAGCALAIG